MIDVRRSYGATRQHIFEEYNLGETNDYVLPQAFGGGRANRLEIDSDREAIASSLVLDYSKESPSSSRRRTASTLFSVDFHPDGNRFIVGSALGDVRLFDLRKIVDHHPGSVSYINLYRNSNRTGAGSGGCYEITGCVFSKDGSEIVATALHDFIYVFDTDADFSKTGTSESASKIRRSDNGEDTNAEPEKTYKNIYKGHYSSRTIKSVNFYGPNSEFVISGSDDALIYIWDKNTTEILAILEGHEDIVNCIVGHPTQPMIASSGIDNVVKLWQNIDDCPSESVLNNRKKKNSEIAQYNIQELQETAVQPICIQQ